MGPYLPGRVLAFTTAFDACHEAVAQTSARRDCLDAAIAQMAAPSQFALMVNRLSCLRGMGTLTGFALAVETTDWNRFTGKSHARRPPLSPASSPAGAGPWP